MRQPTLISIIPDMADILGQKPTTLIERQRALVRSGLLQPLPGRGRGSGVAASPETVAVLIISLLASTTLTDAPALTKSFAEAIPPKRCALTGKKTFGEAVTALLTNETLAKRVSVVVVQPGAGTAEILYDLGGRPSRPPEHSTFLAKTTSGSKIRIGLSVTGETLREIAALVMKMEADQ